MQIPFEHSLFTLPGSQIQQLLRCTLVLMFLCTLSFPSPTRAQESAQETSKQLWANMILSRPKSEKLYFEYDIEGARQISGGEPWRYLYGTGLAEYYPSRFIDLTGELSTGFTVQSAEEESFEATVRLGVRLHLITQIFNSPLITKIRPERMSGKKLSLSVLSRIERRNFWYSGDRPSFDDLRWRNRLEFKLALNEPNLATNGVWYLMADGEYFTPIGDDEAPERFATKYRLRLGLGYRLNYTWRFEVLAMRDEAKETLEGEIEVDAYILDLRLKWFL
jgi:hypothetical protein